MVGDTHHVTLGLFILWMIALWTVTFRRHVPVRMHFTVMCGHVEVPDPGPELVVVDLAAVIGVHEMEEQIEGHLVSLGRILGHGGMFGGLESFWRPQNNVGSIVAHGWWWPVLSIDDSQAQEHREVQSTSHLSKCLC